MSGKEKLLSEKFRFEIKDDGEDFFSKEESKFVNGR